MGDCLTTEQLQQIKKYSGRFNNYDETKKVNEIHDAKGTHICTITKKDGEHEIELCNGETYQSAYNKMTRPIN